MTIDPEIRQTLDSINEAINEAIEAAKVSHQRASSYARETKAAVLTALADATEPLTGDRGSALSIHFYVARKMAWQEFDTCKPPKWSGPKPYTGHWSRWCDRVDAILADLVSSDAVAIYKTPTCWVWNGLIRGYTDGYWLAGRPAPKHACQPWAPLQRVVSWLRTGGYTVQD